MVFVCKFCSFKCGIKKDIRSHLLSMHKKSFEHSRFRLMGRRKVKHGDFEGILRNYYKEI